MKHIIESDKFHSQYPQKQKGKKVNSERKLFKFMLVVLCFCAHAHL